MPRQTPARPTVLLVEDDRDVCEMSQLMLQKRGFDVLTAGDAAQAIILCRVHDGLIDVLLTDLGLPGVSGGELARAAAELRPGMGVVYISGLPRPDAVSRGLIEPDALLIGKPFTADVLAEAVTQVLPARARR